MHELEIVESGASKWIFAPIGKSARLLASLFTPAGYRAFDASEFNELCHSFGLRSLPLIGLSACFVGLALTAQTCLEMQKYNAQELAGGAIAIGLLRELGPLTVGMAWAARVCVIVHEQALAQLNQGVSDEQFQAFFAPRYLAALFMSVPLSIYGLTIGFAVAALAAPFFCSTTMSDFLESARLGIKNTDLIIYFVKLIAINPAVAVLCGSAYGFTAGHKYTPSVATALTGMFIVDVAVMWLATSIAYLP